MSVRVWCDFGFGNHSCFPSQVQYDCVAEQKCHNQMLQIMRTLCTRDPNCICIHTHIYIINIHMHICIVYIYIYIIDDDRLYRFCIVEVSDFSYECVAGIGDVQTK